MTEKDLLLKMAVPIEQMTAEQRRKRMDEIAKKLGTTA